MNILEQTEALKDLPDQALVKEMQMPTGMAPPVFITAELKRRQRMRDEFKRREAQDMPTVAEEVVMAAGMPQGGIADAARAMAPKSSIAQNTGMNEMMPAAATRAPQRMAEGGIMKLREGGKLVKVGNARFYAFPDGEVYVENPDGSRESVTDPRVLGVVRGQANVGPERQESATPLGSEVLQEAAPERPTLDSTLSSARPFSPASMEVTDTRPAVPPSLGMGGERPATLTAATQPTALSEMEKARLATEFTQQQELARAIRDQQEQRPNLSGPSISDVSPTVDLDLTGQYENRDAIESFNKRTFGKPMTPADKAEERLLFNNMNIPPDSPLAEFAGVDNPETQLRGYLGGKDYMDESEDFYDDISKNLLPPKTPDQIAREDLERQKGLEAFFKSQEMRGGRPGGSLPVDVLSQPVTDDTYRMPDVTGPETTASGFFPDLEQAQAADEAARQRGISELGLSPVVSGGTEYLVNDAGNMFKVAGGKLVGVSGGEAMQAIDVAQKQGADFTKSPVGMMPIGTRGVDPDTGLVDPDSPFVPASLDISGLETPSIVGETLQGSGLGDLVGRAVESLPIPQSKEQDAVQPTRLTPTAFATEPEGIDSTLSQGIASIPDGFTLGTAGDTASNALSFGDVSKLVSDDAGGGGGGGGIVPTGGAATGLEARIAQMLSDREKDRETDKYMALAQAGLALMASKNPTLGGAIGEAGLAGVGALRKAKSQYDADILGLMGLEEKARSSRLSREAALAKANRPKTMTGTERVGLLREAGDLREELIKLKADIAREGTLGDFGQVTPFTPEQLAEKAAQARLLESEINKYKGMAYPQLANVQTVNP